MSQGARNDSPLWFFGHWIMDYPTEETDMAKKRSRKKPIKTVRETRDESNGSGSIDFCRQCGAHIPPRNGEGTCPSCQSITTEESCGGGVEPLTNSLAVEAFGSPVDEDHKLVLHQMVRDLANTHTKIDGIDAQVTQFAKSLSEIDARVTRLESALKATQARFNSMDTVMSQQRVDITSAISLVLKCEKGLEALDASTEKLLR